MLSLSKQTVYTKCFLQNSWLFGDDAVSWPTILRRWTAKENPESHKDRFVGFRRAGQDTAKYNFLADLKSIP